MRKIELYVIDLEDNLDDGEIACRISDSLNSIALNCVTHFGDIESKEIGEWHDDIKFNLRDTDIDEYREVFDNRKSGWNHPDAKDIILTKEMKK